MVFVTTALELDASLQDEPARFVAIDSVYYFTNAHLTTIEKPILYNVSVFQVATLPIFG